MVYLALAVGVLAVSASAPLVHAASPAPAMTVAALRIGVAAVLLSLSAGPRLSLVAGLARKELFLILVSGVLLAAHFASWISSLYLTSTAASVALVATQPVFAGLLGRIFLGEGLSWREVMGISVAGLGCAILAAGDVSGQGGTTALFGDALALFGALTVAGYFVVGRGLRGALPLAPYLAAVNAVAGALLIAAAVAFGAPLAGFEGRVYLVIFLCAAVPSVLGHTMLNWSARKIPVHFVGLAILFEPVGASSIQWLAHGEAPPASAVIGGAVIVAGIAAGFSRRPGPRRDTAATRG